jgi:hypothetical protein
MTLPADVLPRKSRLAVLLDHFAEVEDPRDVRRILHPLPEVLLLVVCGTIAACDDYEDITDRPPRRLRIRPRPRDRGEQARRRVTPGAAWLAM